MSKCWYCNNELTSGDNPKHFGICNKCYDEMFKSGDTIIRSLMNKIEELQKQLKSQPAEIIEKIKDYKGEYFEWKIGNKIYPAFKITEEDLDNILKEYQKEK